MPHVVSIAYTPRGVERRPADHYARVAVERATRSGPVAWPAGFAPDRSRRYGEATFWYGLAAGT